MTLNLTQNEIDTLWDKGYRPYEIYTTNPEPVEYCGRTCDVGTITGWDIRFVFSTRELLESMPLFDAVVCVADMSVCEAVWHGSPEETN
jgi:hypothetical protein